MNGPAAYRRFPVRVGWVLLLALALRVGLMAQMGNRYYFADTFEYETAARSILAGHGPGQNFPRAPLYPAVMAVAFLLGGVGNYMAARAIQLVFGMGIVLLSIRLARRAGLPEGGRLVGLGVAVAPTLVFTSAMLYPTALYSFLLLALTLVALELEADPGFGRAVLLGTLMTLAWLTDQIAVLPMLGIVGWLLAGARRRRRGRRLVVATGVAIAVAVALGLPYDRFHRTTYGTSGFFMDKAQYVLYEARHDPAIAGGREIADTTAVFRPLPFGAFVGREWGLLRTRPRAYLADYATEFLHFFNPMPDRLQTRNTYTSSDMKLVAATYFLPVLLLAIVGLLLGAAGARERALLALVPLSTAATYALFFTQTRYRVPVEPHIILLAVLGLTRIVPDRPAPPAAPERQDPEPRAR